MGSDPFDDGAASADATRTYEAGIAALERLIGRQAPVLEARCGVEERILAAKRPTRVITGPPSSASAKAAG